MIIVGTGRLIKAQRLCSVRKNRYDGIVEAVNRVIEDSVIIDYEDEMDLP